MPAPWSLRKSADTDPDQPGIVRPGSPNVMSVEVKPTLGPRSHAGKGGIPPSSGGVFPGVHAAGRLRSEETRRIVITAAAALAAHGVLGLGPAP